MAREVSQLVVELLDRVSQPARRVSSALGGISRRIRETNGTPLTMMERLNGAMQRNNRSLAAARGGLIDAAAGAYALHRALGGPVRAAADLESAMTDVTKVVDFGGAERVAAFASEIQRLSETVPMGARELTELAAQAGMAGIAADDLIPFVEMAGRVGTAFGITGEQAGNMLGRMQTALGTSIEETQLLADAFNHLSDNMATTAPDVMDVMLRVGATAQTYGLAAEETAALASAMMASGAEANVAATSLRNMGMALTRGESATARQSGALRDLGLDATDVARRMQDDAVGTIMDVLERIQQVPEEARAAVTSDLFGNEARALGPLLTNLDLVREALGYVDEESDYAGSATREFNRVLDTFNADSQVFRNQLTNIATALGKALIPRMREFFDLVGPVLTDIREWIEVNPELAATIAQVAGAIVGLKVAAAGLRFAGLLGKGGVLAGLVGAGKGLRLAAAGFGAIATAVGAISAPVLAGIAAAVVAIGGAGYLVWRYWQRLRSIFNGVARAVGERLQPVLDRLEPVMDRLSPVTEALGDAFDWVREAISGAVERVREFFEGGLTREFLSGAEQAEIADRAYQATARVLDAFAAIPARMIEVGGDMIQSLWDGFRSRVDAFIEYLRTLPSRFAEAVRTNLSDAISLDGAPTTSPWRGPPGASIEGRASGGPMTGGRTYLVGEEGPELIRARSSSTVVPNHALGGTTVSVQVNPSFTISGGDPAEIAARVRADLEDAVQEALRGVYGDTGMRIA